MLKVKNYNQYGYSQWAFHPQIKMLSNVEFYFWANCLLRWGQEGNKTTSTNLRLD